MKNIKFINAGAGSGKTYRLTEELASWIGKGNNANEVLLTTFTKKAAAEIRERAEAKLLDNNNFIQVNKLQQAFIGTVHSVGYQFIKKYWYLLGISPELNEISEVEKDIYFSKAISEIPTEDELSSLDELCYQFDFRDTNNFFNPRQWKEDVQYLMNASLLNNIDIAGYDQSLLISEKKIKRLFNGNLTVEHLKALVQKIEQILTNKGVGKWKDAQKKCNKLSHPKKIDLKYALDVCKLIDSLQSIYPDGKTKKYEDVRSLFPEENIQDFEIFKDSVLKYNELIFSIAGRSLEMYRKFKQEEGLVDYTDMEVYFLSLLDKEIVQNEIKESIKLVMVDEFQDSNPIQLSIFMKLSQLVKQSYWVGDPKQAIYGFRGSDPVLIDQIIKEFTKQNNQSLSIDLLKMSWRSVPELVSLSNQIFEERMLEQASDIYLKTIDQIHGPGTNNPNSEIKERFNKWVDNRKIDPLKKKDTIGLLPARNSCLELGGSPIKFWNFLNYGAKGSLKAATNNIYFQKLAQKAASIIEDGKKGKFKVIDKETGNSRNIVGNDICFLVSSNRNVSELSQEFQKLGYPVNAMVEGLTNTIEYRIIQNVVTLFLDRNNALSITELAYLTGEYPSVSGLLEERINLLTSLNKKDQDDPDFDFNKALVDWLSDSEHRKCIESLKAQSTYLSVYYTLQKITNQFNIFQKLLNFRNADLRKANILKLCELAKEYETYCINMNLGSGLLGFLNFVESNKEYNVQAANTNQDAVNVMTYHKSKGLEWPMVILSDLHKNPLDNFHRNEIFSTKIINNAELNVSDPLENRSIEFSFWPFGTSISANDVLKEKIESEPNYFKKEILKCDEYSRLMYVGITRARDYIVFSTNKYKDVIWLENLIPNWSLEKSLDEINFKNTDRITNNFFSLDQPVNVDYEKIMPDKEFEVGFEEPTLIYFEKQIPVSQNKPYLLNPSKVEALKTCKVNLVEELHGRLTVNTNDSTELGNTLHQFLYIKDRTYFKEQVSKSETFIDLGISKEQFIDNVRSFNEFINSRYNISVQHPELSIEVELENQLANGEADLVLETDKGLILIDFKSYAGNEDVLNSNCEKYAGKYSGQLDLYARMLEKNLEPKKVVARLIYYVVQGKIVELIK
ncbi:UvrD-helicase domain-containing protein [Salegentibacter maritimus]|uniref:DNA 3'-5' helicase n=1 Tax=Salegentibacter maritimus TaxID=2794347 RepID=A0ABS0TIX9_9FLAO|nr:UvrD-helicase domain-containing protein [Salegentibacter maritimus]MBI6121027.1 UvrD-helicase domain-containing protein [Salegentibacter maritimus]